MILLSRFVFFGKEQRDLLELEQLQKEEMQKKLQDLEEKFLFKRLKGYLPSAALAF